MTKGVLWPDRWMQSPHWHSQTHSFINTSENVKESYQFFNFIFKLWRLAVIYWWIFTVLHREMVSKALVHLHRLHLKLTPWSRQSLLSLKRGTDPFLKSIQLMAQKLQILPELHLFLIGPSYLWSLTFLYICNVIVLWIDGFLEGLVDLIMRLEFAMLNFSYIIHDGIGGNLFDLLTSIRLRFRW